MGIERANGAFGYITAMEIGRDNIAVYPPKISYSLLELCTGFIV